MEGTEYTSSRRGLARAIVHGGGILITWHFNRLTLQGSPCQTEIDYNIIINGTTRQKESANIGTYLATIVKIFKLMLTGPIVQGPLSYRWLKDLPTSPLAPPEGHRGKIEKNRRSKVPHITGQLVNSTPLPFFSLPNWSSSLTTLPNCPSCVEFSRATSASCPILTPHL